MRDVTAAGHDDFTEIETAILGREDVEDCVVLARDAGPSGRELVAYIVPAGPFVPERLAARLRDALPGRPLPAAYVPLSALPLTSCGQVDLPALARMDVLDADLVRCWKDRLRECPEIDRAAVLIEEIDEPLPALHLSDLIPGWAGAKSGSPEESVTISQRTATTDAGWDRSRLAFSDGGALTIDRLAPKTLTEALLRTADAYPTREIAYVLKDGREVRQSYGALLDEAKSILGGLQRGGLRPGEWVILQIEELRDHFTTFWACVLGGIIPVTVVVAPSYEEREGVVNKLYNTWSLLDHPAILASERVAGLLRGRASSLGMGGLSVLAIDALKDGPASGRIHHPRPADVVFCQLTSGSTGVPKCIQETHQGIVEHIHGSQQFNVYTPDDVSLNWLPVDHVVPILTYHLRDVYLGCRQVHVATDVVLADPLRWLDLIEAHRATLTWSPNFGFKLVSDGLDKVRGRSWDLSSIRFFMNAGEQVTPPVVREFLRRVAPFGVALRAMQPAFGMAEACTCVTYCNDFDLDTRVNRFLKSSAGGQLVKAGPDDRATIDFVDLGPPIPGVQLRITDGENRLVPERVIGRLQIRGGSSRPATSITMRPTARPSSATAGSTRATSASSSTGGSASPAARRR